MKYERLINILRKTENELCCSNLKLWQKSLRNPLSTSVPYTFERKLNRLCLVCRVQHHGSGACHFHRIFGSRTEALGMFLGKTFHVFPRLCSSFLSADTVPGRINTRLSDGWASSLPAQKVLLYCWQNCIQYCLTCTHLATAFRETNWVHLLPEMKLYYFFNIFLRI